MIWYPFIRFCIITTNLTQRAKLLSFLNGLVVPVPLITEDNKQVLVAIRVRISFLPFFNFSFSFSSFLFCVVSLESAQSSNI
jgi:hypothetical protein